MFSSEHRVTENGGTAGEPQHVSVTDFMFAFYIEIMSAAAGDVTGFL